MTDTRLLLFVTAGDYKVAKKKNSSTHAGGKKYYQHVVKPLFITYKENLLATSTSSSKTGPGASLGPPPGC